MTTHARRRRRNHRRHASRQIPPRPSPTCDGTRRHDGRSQQASGDTGAVRWSQIDALLSRQRGSHHSIVSKTDSTLTTLQTTLRQHQQHHRRRRRRAKRSRTPCKSSPTSLDDAGETAKKMGDAMDDGQGTTRQPGRLHRATSGKRRDKHGPNASTRAPTNLDLHHERSSPVQQQINDPNGSLGQLISRSGTLSAHHPDGPKHRRIDPAAQADPRRRPRLQRQDRPASGSARRPRRHPAQSGNQVEQGSRQEESRGTERAGTGRIPARFAPSHLFASSPILLARLHRIDRLSADTRAASGRPRSPAGGGGIGPRRRIDSHPRGDRLRRDPATWLALRGGVLRRDCAIGPAARSSAAEVGIRSPARRESCPARDSRK